MPIKRNRSSERGGMVKKPVITIVATVFLLLMPMEHGLWSRSSNQAKIPRLAALEALPPVRGGIMILGDSITASQDMADLFDMPIHNRGVSAFTTKDILVNLDGLFRGTPDKVFILLGINDILQLMGKDSFFENYRSILVKIKARSPKSKVYALSILPTASPQINTNVVDFNTALMNICVEQNIVYIDLYRHFAEGSSVNMKYVTDGLHLSSQGYLLFKDALAQYLSL